ncbi:hypothetical protein ACI2LF_43660 [Kribbella sp. NPDC020789]
MITPHADAPCWTWPTVEDGPHYPTRAAALEDAATFAPGRLIEPKEMRVPCWAAACDGCGWVECEDTDETHHPAHEAIHVRAVLVDLQPTSDGRLLCPACSVDDPAATKPAPEPVLEFLAWLMRLDDPFDVAGQAARDDADVVVRILDRTHAVWHALGLHTRRPRPDSPETELPIAGGPNGTPRERN